MKSHRAFLLAFSKLLALGLLFQILLCSPMAQQRGPGVADGPYVAGNGVKPPVPLYQPLPAYTEEARNARVEGIVLIQAIVRKDGTVDSFKVLKSLGHGLDESAVNTIATKWQFQPGTLNGAPVDVQVIIEVAFRIYRKKEQDAKAMPGSLDEALRIPSDEKVLKPLPDIAEQGNYGAQFIVGSMYVEGKGVPQDYIQAYKYLALFNAALADKKNPEFQNAVKRATDLIDSIAGKMTAEQIADAGRLVEEWKSAYLQSKCGAPDIKGNWRVEEGFPSSMQRPPYSQQAREAGIEGSVLVECIIRKEGRADQCKVVRGLGYGLDEAAIFAVTGRWRFMPAKCNGEPVDKRTLIPVMFRLNPSPPGSDGESRNR